ncbi:MAG: oxygen-dependent coproporphyrinogen oxidase [bacterium]|nr:oxygen-dependent coproporphyrinogen oxidase [bacterium]
MAEANAPDPTAVHTYLADLQDQICDALEREDGRARFSREERPGPGGGLARPRALADGAVIEKAAVHFTHAKGPGLPPAATERRPELAGAPFEAVSLSMIVHPQNPYVPVTHMNLRCFIATPETGDAVWWVGGGFDLTPTYGFEEDVVHWHRVARAACAPFGDETYPRFKAWCDEYFFLPHREEARGVGGVFFDDLVLRNFPNTFAFLRSIGDHFLPAYLPLVQRRRSMDFGDRERQFQLLRRGRYVEFNLVYDRGTKYGLQSGRRVESVLASMPPLVRWVYDAQPQPGSPEAELAETFLKPRDWLVGLPEA